MMQKTITHIHHALTDIYSVGEINAFVGIIVEAVCGWNRTQFLLNKTAALSDEQRENIEKIVARLQHQEPIQYILGKTEFYSLPFELNRHTLIPRPETEELVDWIVSEHQNRTGKLLDIGTGSGCIAVSLAKHLPKMDVSAMDISAEALKMARKNAETNGVEVLFFQEDMLACRDVARRVSTAMFDLIVSNPPYILENEKAEMQDNVLCYEPYSALFVPNENPLLFYEAIVDFAQKNLRSGGALYLEINQKFGKETAEMLRQKGFSDIEVRQDLQGNDRMIKCRLDF
jgi:release factor glutamine methyltransferase